MLSLVTSPLTLPCSSRLLTIPTWSCGTPTLARDWGHSSKDWIFPSDFLVWWLMETCLELDMSLLESGAWEGAAWVKTQWNQCSFSGWRAVAFPCPLGSQIRPERLQVPDIWGRLYFFGFSIKKPQSDSFFPFTNNCSNKFRMILLSKLLFPKWIFTFSQIWSTFSPLSLLFYEASNR